MLMKCIEEVLLSKKTDANIITAKLNKERLTLSKKVDAILDSFVDASTEMRQGLNKKLSEMETVGSVLYEKLGKRKVFDPNSSVVEEATPETYVEELL